MFYTTFEGATDFNEIGDAPFGNYTGQGNPDFAAPFTNRKTGTSVGNLFPAPNPPRSFSSSNPATGFPYDTLAHFFGAFGTIGSSPAFFNHNSLPYAEEYELSIQRQITPSDLVTISYVGSQGHHLLSSISANPGNAALCKSLSNASAVQAGTGTCGPGGENNIYFPIAGSHLSTGAVLQASVAGWDNLARIPTEQERCCRMGGSYHTVWKYSYYHHRKSAYNSAGQLAHQRQIANTDGIYLNKSTTIRPLKVNG
jgi:hypothetical protein